MSTASMELLKGSKQKAVEAALGAGEEPQADGVEEVEEVEVDIDKLSGKEMDALVKEYEIEIEGWGTAIKTVDQKRAALKEHFGEGDGAGEQSDGTENEAETPAVEEAEEDDVAKAKTKAKTETKKTGKKETGKTAGKGTGKALQKVHPGEVLEPDLIASTAHALENLKEDEARKLAAQLMEETEFNFFKLGGVLSVIQENGWFQPYGNFKEYVEAEHGLGYRKAMYFIEIYNGVVELNVPWNEFKGVGWTKLKEILPVLTPENVKEWVKLAEKSTTLQLIEHVKSAKKKAESQGSIEDLSAKTVTTKTFKVHEDQKATIEAAIDKAKKESETTVDTVALEYICLDYLNAKPKKAAGGKSLKEMMSESGLEKTLEVFEEVFPQVNLTAEIEEEEAL